MSQRASSPSTETAFSLAWSRIFPLAMVRGTATEPIALDDTPSPRRSPERPTQPPSGKSKNVIVIDDSDDNDGPSSHIKSTPTTRLASRGSAHPWKTAGGGEPAQPDPMKFDRARSDLNSPAAASLKRSPKPSPKSASSLKQAVDSPQQQQLLLKPRTPSGQFGSQQISGSPLAPPEFVTHGSAQRRVSSRSRTPSQKAQISSRGVNDYPLARVGQVADADVEMQDEVISEEQTVQQKAVIQQKEMVQEDEVMQDIDQRDEDEDMDNKDEAQDDEEPAQITVGMESPLVERIKQRRKKKGTISYVIKDEDVDNSALISDLRRFEENMEEDHAIMVRWLLHDARRASSSISKFVDEESPFKPTESIYLGNGALPAGHVKVKVDVHSSKKGKTRVQLISNKIKSEVSRIPRYHAHTLVKRNILTAEDDTLRYMPYLGEDHSTQGKRILKRTKEDLEIAFAGKKPKDSRELERQSLFRGYLDTWLEELKLGIDVDGLTRYTLVLDNWDIELKMRDIQALKKGEDRIETWDMCKRFSDTFEEVFRCRLKDVILGERRVKELAEAAKNIREEGKKAQAQASASKDRIAERLSTFTDWTCLICGALYCQTHGDWHDEIIEHSEDSDSDVDQPQRPKYLPIHRQHVMGYNDILRKHDVRHAKANANENAKPEVKETVAFTNPCSNQCCRIIDPKTQDKYELLSEKRIGIESMVISMGSYIKRSCMISVALNLPCWQVDEYICTLKPRIVPPLNLAQTKKPDWYDNKKKTLKDHWQDHTDAQIHERRVQAQACAHDGPCDVQCICYKLNILCESFCGCPDDCARKWTGCGCRSLSGINCVTDTCICIQMNRECGPLCGSCGAIPRIRAANKHNDDLFATGCQNVPLQRGVSKRTIIGESQLVGFGLYLAEPVKKGAYLSEYTGEAISNNESERRGVIYDRKYLSFLFDLNSEWVIDAARSGNKTRFINHAESEKNGLNCTAKIVLVNGEHRIKFYAQRDIQVGEELLFNYGRKFAERQGLNAKLPTGKKGGLVVGDEAIDALDGLDPAIRRGRNTAMRGGKGKKARKTAGPGRLEAKTAIKSNSEKPRRLGVEREVKFYEDGDMMNEPLPAENYSDHSFFEDHGAGEEEEGCFDDEEEEDVLGLGNRRAKRTIKMPAKYTR